MIVEIVADTSAVVAVITEQPEKSDLIRLTQGADLVAPSSLYWEVGNALSAMFKRKALTLEGAQRCLEIFREIPMRYVDVELSAALNMAARYSIYAYDAYVLACCTNRRAPVLTLDSGMKARAGELKIEVIEVKVV